MGQFLCVCAVRVCVVLSVCACVCVCIRVCMCARYVKWCVWSVNFAGSIPNCIPNIAGIFLFICKDNLVAVDMLLSPDSVNSITLSSKVYTTAS